MKDLIEALQIFLKYGNPVYPTHCEHDALYVMIDPGLVSEEDKAKLDELGYNGPPMALVCLDKIIREETLNSGHYIASFVTEVSKFMQAGYFVRHV